MSNNCVKNITLIVLIVRVYLKIRLLNGIMNDSRLEIIIWYLLIRLDIIYFRITFITFLGIIV